MSETYPPRFSTLQKQVTEKKATGATYTPKLLADFVAAQIANSIKKHPKTKLLRILDPAIGHGELLLSLVGLLEKKGFTHIEICGFETNEAAIKIAESRLLKSKLPLAIDFRCQDFLNYVLDTYQEGCIQAKYHQTDNYKGHKLRQPEQGELFPIGKSRYYDVIIANPPYVRTQILGAKQAQLLAQNFGLTGRVDLYYAFILAMSKVLSPKGIACIIVSNRFMTTKSGKPVRQALLDRYNIVHAWDLGDTKLFDAAVLPAVLLLEGTSKGKKTAKSNATKHSQSANKTRATTFTTIYESSKNDARDSAQDVISALNKSGSVVVKDGRIFNVTHGTLNTSGTSDGVWRVSNHELDSWLALVEQNTWGQFSGIGKIRVGVKTCAESTFIRHDWDTLDQKPELLKPVTTHHVARRFRPQRSKANFKEILYPHTKVNGKRTAVDLSKYPASAAYLNSHKEKLKARKYVLEAGREWFEIWVPQDPDSWKHPKLVFRDISEEPTFWLDLDGTIVNGDCYWICCRDNVKTDLLWLAAAVGNSTFTEVFYDRRFQNKLYAGRRRFITQYVEQFPLPDPDSPLSRKIIKKAKHIFQLDDTDKIRKHYELLDNLVWMALTGKSEPN